MNIEYLGNDEEYIVRNMVEKDLSQVVSRGHSRKNFFRRTEQFVVFYLSTERKRGNRYGTFRRNS